MPSDASKGTKKLLAVVAAVVLVAVIVGVVAARRSNSSKATALVEAAPDTTIAAGTAHLNATVSTSAGFGLSLSETGTTDFRARNVDLGLSINGAAANVRVVGTTAYLQAAGKVLPGGAHWAAITQADVGSGASVISATVGLADPFAALESLKGLASAPVAAGTMEVKGVATTAYQVVLDLRSRVAGTGKAESAILPIPGEAIRALAQDKELSRVPGTVWLDSAGRVRHLSWTISLTLNGAISSDQQTFDFSDFGVPVHVVAPAPADTAPFSALSKGLAPNGGITIG